MNDKKSKNQLNIAGKLAYIFLHSKLTILIIICSILLGVLAFLFTPKTYNPEIVVPTVNIFVARPGSSSTEILHQVVQPLEALMASIPGVDHTYGASNDDQGMVTVRFKVNENEENSLVKVYNQINSNMNRMPSGTLQPLIQSVSLYDIPIVTITLSSSNEKETAIRAIAEKILKNLRNIPKVGKTSISGASQTAVRIWLDPNKIATYHIPLQNIKMTLENNNVGINIGDIQSGSQKILLRARAHLINTKNIEQMIIGIFNGNPVLLKDVAKIEIGPSDENIHSLFAFGPGYKIQNKSIIGKLNNAVTINFAREKGSNGVLVANDIINKLNIIKNNLIPKDITVTITRNYGADASDAVNTLIEHLLISIAAVVMILLLFLGPRESFIVALSIPLILFVVLGIGWITGQTINRITLFAIILSLGLLVDDSIVVIENIHRHILSYRTKNFSRLIINAANEIGKPTIIATFTVILALIPMAFVGGMMGPFMMPIPFNAPIAMLVSLIIAYTVVPYLAYKWLKLKARKHINNNTNNSDSANNKLIHRIYLKLFQPLLYSRKKRHLFYIIIIGLLFIVMLQPLWQFIRPIGPNAPLSTFGVELKMLPDDNVNTFLVEINGPAGTSRQKTEQAAKAIANIISKNKYIENEQLFFGKAAPEDFAAMARGDALIYGSNYAEIRVNLTSKHNRSIGSHEIVQQLHDSLMPVYNAFPDFHIKLFETPPGPPVRAQLESALYGPDYNQLREIAKTISKKIYNTVYGAINIDNSVTENLPEYQIVIKQNAAIIAGLSPKILSDDLQTYFSGAPVGSIHDDKALEPMNIILKLPDVSRETINSFNKLYFNNRINEMIHIDKVADINIITHDKPIFTRDEHELVYLTGDMLYSSPVNAVITITSKINNILFSGKHITVDNLGFMETQPNNPMEYKLLWQGEMRLTLDVFRDLGSAFIVSILLIYLLLVAFYRSFFIPMIIMGAIPLTIIGVFPGHWLMHQPFTATSMIGVIALAGIVVRNSLLLVDFILEKQREGLSIENAVMGSGVSRLLPILLTAMAIVLGSAIMISDPVFSGLAISLIFGAFASTVLTLFVIPLVYYGWWKRKYSKIN